MGNWISSGHRAALAMAALLAAPGAGATACNAAGAAAVIDASLAALGGRSRLESVHAIDLQANVVRNLLEQSIRPEGPWIKDMYRLELALDFAGARAHGVETRSARLGWLAPPERPSPPFDYLVADGVAAARRGGQLVPTGQSLVQDIGDLLAFNPLRVMLTAAAAPEACLEHEVTSHGTVQDVVAWTGQDIAARVLVARDTHLPSEVAWTGPRPRDVFWNAWGDVENRLRFENWSLRPNGLRVPMQWSQVRNGLPYQTWELGSLVFDAPRDPATWTIPASLRADIAKLPDIDGTPLGSPRSPPTEIAPGLVQVPGRWNIAFVRQHDGIVVIEAPIGSGYSARVLEEAERRFPGLPVKAVVSTSDAWPHIAGLREYAARGIPIYVLDLDEAIVERLLAAPHASRPDTLARHGRAADLHPVSARTAIGDGDERIELIPLRTAVGERQMLAWLPSSRIVYTSDLVQPSGDNDWYAPEMLLELRQRFESLGIVPLRAFGMHYAATDWAGMDASLDAYLAGAAPAPAD